MTRRESTPPDDIDLRPATHDDYDDVVAFTTDTWDEQSDYIPRVYHDWIETNHSQTLVADAGDDIAGIAQVVMLSDYESWAQGMRVNSDFRGLGIGTTLTQALFDWAREQGAVVARNMVFSWNQAGLGQSRAVGFEPVTEFRWLQPDPTDEPVPASVTDNVDAAWTFWTASEARTHLSGLALDMDESWAMRDLTRQMLARASDETALLVISEGGTRAFAYRTRTVEREEENGLETWAEYGVGAWTDLEAADTLLAAISADAATCGADRTRVLVPETPRVVSDGASLRADPSGHPDFVFAADLTADH